MHPSPLEKKTNTAGRYPVPAHRYAPRKGIRSASNPRTAVQRIRAQSIRSSAAPTIVSVSMPTWR
jgi:hypothetical protein